MDEPDLEAAAAMLVRQYAVLEEARDNDDIRPEVCAGLKQTLVGGLRVYGALVGVEGVEDIMDHARMMAEATGE